MSKAGREQRLAALAIKKMAIVCSTNNRFENAAIFSGKRLTTLSKSEAHFLADVYSRISEAGSLASQVAKALGKS